MIFGHFQNLFATKTPFLTLLVGVQLGYNSSCTCGAFPVHLILLSMLQVFLAEEKRSQKISETQAECKVDPMKKLAQYHRTWSTFMACWTKYNALNEDYVTW